MKWLEGPEPEKRGDEWTHREIRRYLRWCNKPVNRTKILLSIMQILSRKGYSCAIEQIEEIWADLCLRLPLRLQGFDPRKGRSALDYLITGCVQSAIDQRRVEHRRREIRRSMKPSDLERFTAFASGVDVESELVDRLTSQRLKQLVRDELAPADRRIVEAYYLDEKTLREIAQEVGCTPTAAKMRLFRARRRLIELWVGQEPQGIPRRVR